MVDAPPLIADEPPSDERAIPEARFAIAFEECGISRFEIERGFHFLRGQQVPGPLLILVEVDLAFALLQLIVELLNQRFAVVQPVERDANRFDGTAQDRQLVAAEEGGKCPSRRSGDSGDVDPES